MTEYTVTADDLDSPKDHSGFVHDDFADHLGDGTLQRGYDVGSLTRGLVAYYPFDGDVNDKTPLGNDGTDNTSAGYVSGQVGSDAKDFDGTDDYITIPSFNKFSEFTVTFWSYHRSPNDSDIDSPISIQDNQFITAKEQGDGTIDFVMQDSGGTFPSVTASLSANTWYHWAMYWDGSTMEFFKDGSSAGTTSNSSSQGDNKTNTIGAKDAGVGGNYLDGQVDDLRIYDRALSQPEIEALSNLTSTSTVHNGDVLQ